MPSLYLIQNLENKYHKAIEEGPSNLSSLLIGIRNQLQESLLVLNQNKDKTADDCRREIRYRQLLLRLLGVLHARFNKASQESYTKEFFEICKLFENPLLAASYTDEDRILYAGLLSCGSFSTNDDWIFLLHKAVQLLLDAKDKTPEIQGSIYRYYRSIGDIYRITNNLVASQYYYRALEGYVALGVPGYTIAALADSLRDTVEKLELSLAFHEDIKSLSTSKLLQSIPSSFADPKDIEMMKQHIILCRQALFALPPEINSTSALRRFSHINSYTKNDKAQEPQSAATYDSFRP